MTQPGARFCRTCGAAFTDDSRFCRACGSPRSDVGAATQPAAAPAAGVVAGGPAPSPPATTRAAGAMRGAQTAMTYAGVAGALPWQTIVQGQRPDLGAFLRQAGVPLGTAAAQTIVRRSIRKPALALLFTTIVDALVTVISGQPAAGSALLMRLLTGSGTGLLGLLVGKRGGFGRTLVGIGSIATSVFQLYNAGSMILAAVQAQSGFLTLLPSLVSTASVILVAVKTVIMAFRRKRSAS